MSGTALATCRSAWPRPTSAISHDPTLKGAPTGYVMPVREVRASVGAGFIYPMIGAMSTMPGLGTKPAFMAVDVDEKGNVVGLF